jgi:hypothetical protein
MVLGVKLRAYTLSHSPDLFLWQVVFWASLSNYLPWLALNLDPPEQLGLQAWATGAWPSYIFICQIWNPIFKQRGIQGCGLVSPKLRSPGSSPLPPVPNIGLGGRCPARCSLSTLESKLPAPLSPESRHPPLSPVAQLEFHKAGCAIPSTGPGGTGLAKQTSMAPFSILNLLFPWGPA